MPTKKIRDLFHIWQGHQITDKEIYNSEKGDVPILTGHNAIKGYRIVALLNLRVSGGDWFGW